MSEIGIDLGTSFSSASWINPSTNMPEIIIFNENGSAKIPSVVFFPQNGEPLVGQGPYQQVENVSGMSPDDRNMVLQSTVFSIKRKMKRNGKIYAGTRSYTHTEVISLILSKIREEAIKSCHFNDELTEVTITYPVVFEEWKKDMLKEAAIGAGFTNVHLLEEPVSAAIGFIKANKLDDCKGLLVYDFGGGTFDVAYVKTESDGTYRVPLLPLGDPQCGGDDIDLLMYQEWNSLAWQTKQRHIAKQENEIDRGFISQCRKNKELLSIMPQAIFNEILPPPGFVRLSMKMERAHFNEKIRPVVERTIKKTQQLLDEIKSNNYPLDCAILIGGSSRIPLVMEMLQEILPVKPQTTGIVDTAVALGASYYRQGFILKRETLSDIDFDDCYCIYCGKKLSTAYKFCVFCGKTNYLYKK